MELEYTWLFLKYTPLIQDYSAADFGAGIGGIADRQWPIAADQSWTDPVQQPIAAVPGGWASEAGAGDWGEAVPAPQVPQVAGAGLDKIPATGWDS